MAPSETTIRALLFSLFAIATATLAAVIQPTYDDLLVPQLSAGSLYPALGTGSAGGFLTGAAAFSGYLVTNLVDPAVTLVSLAIGGLYLVRAVASRLRARLDDLLPRFIVAVLVANVTLPLAGAVFGLAGATYPVVAGFDGGAWQHWVNIGGVGMAKYAWDNGVLAFVLAFVIFSLILLLAIAIAVRNALLGVLLVVLPIFSLLWPIPIVGSLARRGWLWFVELAFLPCVVVIPLELAVGSPSILLTTGYLTVALAAPALISLAGTSLGSLGFPSAASALTGGVQRGLAAASVVGSGLARPTGALLETAGKAPGLAQALQRSSGQGASLALPSFSSEMLGVGAARLFRHVAASTSGGGPPSAARGRPWSSPPIRRGDG